MWRWILPILQGAVWTVQGLRAPCGHCPQPRSIGPTPRAIFCLLSCPTTCRFHILPKILVNRHAHHRQVQPEAQSSPKGPFVPHSKLVAQQATEDPSGNGRMFLCSKLPLRWRSKTSMSCLGSGRRTVFLQPPSSFQQMFSPPLAGSPTI
uniref:Putative secreted protein n=1 Tax=Ixodes ricinus TaxID=34613 RepID=A0A6B0UVL5_IXORI